MALQTTIPSYQTCTAAILCMPEGPEAMKLKPHATLCSLTLTSIHIAAGCDSVPCRMDGKPVMPEGI